MNISGHIDTSITDGSNYYSSQNIVYNYFSKTNEDRFIYFSDVIENVDFAGLTTNFNTVSFKNTTINNLSLRDNVCVNNFIIDNCRVNLLYNTFDALNMYIQNLYIENLYINNLPNMKNINISQNIKKVDLLNCTNLTSIKFGSFDKANAENFCININNCPNFNSIYSMFQNSAFPYTKVKSIFNQIDFTNKIERCDYAFQNYNGEINEDLIFKGENITNLYQAFSGAKTIKNIYVEGKNINNLSFAFSGAPAIENLCIKNIQTRLNENSLSSAFCNMQNLENLVISNINSLSINLLNAFATTQESYNAFVRENLKYVEVSNCNFATQINFYKVDIADLSDLTFKISNCDMLMNLYFPQMTSNLVIENCPNLMSIDGFVNSRLKKITPFFELGIFNEVSSLTGTFRGMKALEENDFVLDGTQMPRLTRMENTFAGTTIENFTFKNFTGRNVLLYANYYYFSKNSPSPLPQGIKKLSIINCDSSLNINTYSVWDGGIVYNTLTDVYVKDTVVNSQFVSNLFGNNGYSTNGDISTDKKSNIRNIIIENSTFPMGGFNLGLGMKNLEYVTTNQNAPLTMHFNQSDNHCTYLLNFYTNASHPLYTKVNSFIGRDLIKLASLDIGNLQNYRGINDAVVQAISGGSSGQVVSLYGYEMIGCKNVSYDVNIKNVSYYSSWNRANFYFEAMGAYSDKSLDNYVLKTENIDCGDISIVEYFWIGRQNTAYPKATHIKNLSFTNFGYGRLMNASIPASLSIENLPSLTQNCLTNIIENGIVNLASNSRTGTIRLCNEQMMNLTDDAKNLAASKGWTITEVQ